MAMQSEVDQSPIRSQLVQPTADARPYLHIVLDTPFANVDVTVQIYGEEPAIMVSPHMNIAEKIGSGHPDQIEEAAGMLTEAVKEARMIATRHGAFPEVNPTGATARPMPN